MISWEDLFEWSRNWADGSSLPVLVPLHLLYSFASLLELVIWRDGWLSNTAEAYGLSESFHSARPPKLLFINTRRLDYYWTSYSAVVVSPGVAYLLARPRSWQSSLFAAQNPIGNGMDGLGGKRNWKKKKKKNWQKAHTRICRGSRSEQHRCLLINRLYTFFFPRELKRQKGPRVSERERWGGPIDSIIFPVYQSTFGAVTYWLSIHA